MFDFKKKKKVLLLTSPCMRPFVEMPYLSVPLLAGQLKKAGYKTKCHDFTLDFFIDISNIKYIKKTYKKLKEIEKKYNKFNDMEFKRAYRLYRYLCLYYKKNKKFKKKHMGRIIHFALLPYNYIIQNYYINKVGFNSIYNFCFNREINFYIDYLEKKIDKLVKPYDIICISKFPDYDLIGIFTLACMIKEKYKDKKIVLGGCTFGPIAQELKQHPRIFDLFCDYILIQDGEVSIVELVDFISGKTSDITKVSNLIYKNEKNEVIENPEYTKIDINKIAYSDYSDFNFKKYSSKAPAISVNLSKGCYWGKCRFCTFSTYRNFQLKTIKNAVDELEHYIKKYKIKSVQFTDDAIFPKYYTQLADEIIKRKLKFNFSSFAIFDSNFTYEIFEKLKQAGATKLVWGLETHSKKVFDIVNKSGCFEKRAEILKNAKKAGIINSVNVIEGLPGETFTELLETVKFIYDNADYIDALSLHKFEMQPDAEFTMNPEKYGLKILGKNDFALRYSFDYTYETGVNEYNSFLRYYSSRDRKAGLKEIVTDYLSYFAPELL